MVWPFGSAASAVRRKADARWYESDKERTRSIPARLDAPADINHGAVS